MSPSARSFSVCVVYWLLFGAFLFRAQRFDSVRLSKRFCGCLLEGLRLRKSTTGCLRFDGRPIRDVAERGGRRRLSETRSEPLPATLAAIKARNSSKADADDPTLIEPIQLAPA
jgi:hypothetical protein